MNNKIIIIIVVFCLGVLVLYGFTEFLFKILDNLVKKQEGISFDIIAKKYFKRKG